MKMRLTRVFVQDYQECSPGESSVNVTLESQGLCFRCKTEVSFRHWEKYIYNYVNGYFVVECAELIILSRPSVHQIKAVKSHPWGDYVELYGDLYPVQSPPEAHESEPYFIRSLLDAYAELLMGQEEKLAGPGTRVSLRGDIAFFPEDLYV